MDKCNRLAFRLLFHSYLERVPQRCGTYSGRIRNTVRMRPEQQRYACLVPCQVFSKKRDCC